MARLACLLAALLLAPAPVSDPAAPGTTPDDAPAPFVRVTEGAARLLVAEGVRSLEPEAGATSIAGEVAALEAGARSALELVWRGQASASLTGPLALELGPGPTLTLERFRTVELEVRRGHLTLELGGLGQLALTTGALRLRSLPDGVAEILNRGGSVLVVTRAGASSLEIAPGRSLRLRAPEG